MGEGVAVMAAGEGLSYRDRRGMKCQPATVSKRGFGVCEQEETML